MTPQNGSDARADFKKARRRKATLTDPTKVDRLPPHSTEGEQGVLGCVLLSPDCLDVCQTKIASPEAFYDLRHRAIYEVLIEMRERKAPIDLITVQQTLKDRQQLEAVGGLAYLASLPDAVPSAANLDYYVEIVREKFVLREVLTTCTETIADIYEHQGEIEAVIDRCDVGFTKIRRLCGDSDAGLSNKEVMRSLVEKWEAAANGTLPKGIRTGFADLDRWTGGFKPKQLIVVAARPSRGKSSLALNIADHAAVVLREPALIFSLEMSREELMERAVCSRGRVDGSRLNGGTATPREFAAASAAQIALHKAPLVIVDKAGLSIAQLSSMARNIVQRDGIKLVIVDHLGLVNCGERGRSRYEEITKVSGGLKTLAMDLGVPVLALAQLNRDSDKEEREPRMSDLRDSGSIEQDADIVTLLAPNADDTSDAQRVKLIVAKHRGGRTGVINLVFHRQWTRFDSASYTTEGAS